MTSEVLVVFPHHASFIDQDLEILARRFAVSTLEYRRPRDRYRLLRELRGVRVAIAWFVLGYAYAMTRFRALHESRCLLIPGGWDVEALPELGYGEMRSERRARQTSYALSVADRVLAVSQFSRDKVTRWAPGARVDVLYHGFDPGIFAPGSNPREGVLTVSRISPETWRLKGLPVLADVARQLPEVPFTIAGDVSNAGPLLGQLPPNVKVAGFVSRPDLVALYQRAKVYVQLSAVESFGCSLAEAMLCGCVPVVTERGALSEVVGSVGKRVPYGEVSATVDAVRDALESDEGEKARERIETQFPLERRAGGLESEVRRLLDG